ncbi:zinc finger protein 292 [Cheilinus undulatus]|uniref:zinc finger protein 292 n=1 Tax=Cheilinus undulatus TaxID=241271 RepID=UPI001BD39E05|nr:zinc finger protein 292 [Cheilinus undulatus]
MADSESDLETDGLELALDTLYIRHCSSESSLNSKCYCSAFCELIEEYTGQWHVPLPQLKVLRTALCSFTTATAAFPDDCQHIHYVLSSLALSFFELMLFFSKEEFVEEPLKDILDSFLECSTRLQRHRNIYFQHVKQIIKAGGPWENPVLQGILKEADLSPQEVEDHLSSELPVFFELRVRYLQACERLQEAKALAKSCMENREAGKHLYFHQAYLTCLYKASLHEHLQKEMAEIDGRDAVEIICNTERVEKDELLLSLCKSFLTQQLHNGDMYYIWDLVFIWSRLHLRAHSSREGFLAECLQLASSASNVRAIFPFIKLVTTELGGEGVQVCVELCARALQLCDIQADSVTRSLVCKTIAFLLPHDLEICRACALLVFCQERSLEAYRTVCLLYMHPDQEQHPHNNPVRTCVRFHILQMLKERLCFDPEFWNLLAIRTQCLELMNDKVMKAAVLNEMREEEEKQYREELSMNDLNDFENVLSTQGFNSCPCTETVIENQDFQEKQAKVGTKIKGFAPSHKPLIKRRQWRRVLRRKKPISDEEVDFGDDPEFKYNLKSSSHKTMYSLRRNHTNKENSAAVKHPRDRKREYLSRCVKSQILKRKGRKRWLQGLPRFEPVQVPVQVQTVKIPGKKRGRKPLQKLELSYPENEISVTEEESGLEKLSNLRNTPDISHNKIEFEVKSEQEEWQSEVKVEPNVENENKKQTDLACCSSLDEQIQEKSLPHLEGPSGEPQAAIEAEPELDGPPLELVDCPIEQLHSYSLKSKCPESEKQPSEYPAPEDLHEDTEETLQPKEETEDSNRKVGVKRTWRERMLRTQQYAHLKFYCTLCRKDYKGLNVMRHALSHLKKRKCILCGKRFKHLPFAKKHVLDHIDEMFKQNSDDNKPSSEETPNENGIVNNVEQPTQPQVSKKVKQKVSDLDRDVRIIRNIRTLIKKTCLVNKKSKNPRPGTAELIDFKDDQVIIKDGVVIVKHQPVIEKDGEGVGEEQPEGQNGCVVDMKYHLCPSESCDRVFLRISSTLMRHAVKCHISDEAVLDKVFVWAKHKCTLCLRKLQFFQHYKDHMKQHDNPLQYFCYHLDCNQRFLTQQELKDHISTHQPFRPQCPFTACEKLFPSLQCLYDHEWRHYNPTPQRDELEVGPSRQRQSAEAPWKQRVKVEEIWLQNKTEQRLSPALERAEASNLEDFIVIETENQSDEICETPTLTICQEQLKSENCSETYQLDDIKAAVNGYVAGTVSQVSLGNIIPSSTGAATATPRRSAQKKPRTELDPLDVKNREDMSITDEVIRHRLGEPTITEHKTFKPDDPTYGTSAKANFVRPPPSTYLDESVTSMRKRRSEEEPAQKKTIYWKATKKNIPDPKTQPKEENVAPENKIRHRCVKCLSSFGSIEELQKHQALNTCSALFGFDSDDES